MDPGDASRSGSTDVDFVALAAGRMVGRYEIVATLGQGGFGITYRARDTRLGRDVAIKEYLPSALAIRHEGATVLPRSTKVADDFTWGRDRFVAEGQTLASLQDAAAIVRVFDFLEANGTAYIVMQLLSGQTLEDHLKRKGNLTPKEMERILWPLLDGLEQVHNAGFLHRDIKPANILLDAAGSPTLIDFGSSRAAMADRTVAMTAIFTPGYAAAEQFTSARQGPWTDIYGLAATLYQATTGRVPPSAVERILQDDYEPLSVIRPEGFARALLLGIDAGLVVRAGDRPQSIADWRRMLASTNGSGAVTLVLPRPSTPVATAAATVSPEAVKPSSALRKVAMWSAASAAAVLIAAGGYWALGPSKPVTVDPLAERPRTEQQVQRAEAETKRKAETEAAEKLRAEEEARRQAAQAELQRAEAEAARKKAETEAAERDRIQQEVQKARDALVAAEAARKQAEEEAARLRAQAETAAAAAEKKRLEDAERQKAEAEARARADQQPAAATMTPAPSAAAAAPPQAAASASQPRSARDGNWFGALDCKSGGRTSVQGSVTNGVGTLGGGAVAIRVQLTGDNVSITVRPSGDNTPFGARSAASGQMSGKISGRGVYAQGSVGGDTCTVSLVGP